MTDVQTLTVALRDRAGKGAARQSRREGYVPAVIYGDRKDPVMINILPVELLKQARRKGFYTTLFDLKVGAGTERVLARDIQFDPVTDQPIHVDFLRVSSSATITVNVPVIFLNEAASPGLKRGGVLNVVRHEIAFVCRADAIPQAIEIDLTGTEINDSVHISSVKLPDGATPVIGRDFTVATIAAPSAVRSEVAEAAQAAATAPAAADKKK